MKIIFFIIKFTEVVLLADLRQSLKNSKCIVIKIGSSTLAHSNGRLNIQRFEKITAQIANLYNMGIKIIFVTSGAIGAGMGRLNMKSRPKTIPEKQAAAAVGQGILLHMYEKMFCRIWDHRGTDTFNCRGYKKQEKIYQCKECTLCST
jgi:hypothetical protein